MSARLQTYEAYKPYAPFDSTVSVGEFEHFAKPGMRRRERMEVYDGLFRRCAP
ncbi:MAG: hypothetical protein JJ897_21340 [Marinibacterium sp.]|nr:hypothetical protein [Marinibacterium sp.]